MNISLLDIPDYLQNSELVQILREQGEDNSDIIVPEDSFKPDDTVVNIEDWFQLFRTVKYWGISYPDSLISYYIDDPVNVNLGLKYFFDSQDPAVNLIKDQVIPLIREKYIIEWSNLQFSFLELMLDKPWDIEKLTSNPNITIDIIAANPNLPQMINRNARWSSYEFSLKDEVTFDYVLKHPKIEWNIDSLSQNKNITPEIVLSHPEIAWDPDGLIANPNFTFEFILSHPEIFSVLDGRFFGYRNLLLNKDFVENFDLYYERYQRFFVNHPEIDIKSIGLDSNPRITWDYVLRHPELHWNLYGLLGNPNIHIEDVISTIQQNQLNHLNLFPIWINLIISGRYPAITFNIMRQYPNIDWNYKNVILDPELDINFVLDHPEINWNPSFGPMLFDNPSITLQDLITYPNIDWNYRRISEDQKLTLDFVLLHPDLPWDYNDLSTNPGITLEMVAEHPTIPWNFLRLAHNPNVTAKYILSHPEIYWGSNVELPYILLGKNDFNPEVIIDYPYWEWNFQALSNNEDVSWDLVYQLRDRKWDFNRLSDNPMFLARERYLQQRFKEDQFEGVYF